MAFNEIRPGCLAERFAEIETEVFDPPWPPGSFGDGPDRVGLSWWIGDRCAGFVYGGVAADEAELWRIAVLPACRRRGGARALADAFARTCRERGARTIFLEVAAENHAAQAFYRQVGFGPCGARRDYFGPGVDAVLMRRELA